MRWRAGIALLATGRCCTVVQLLLVAIGSSLALAPPVRGVMLIAPLVPGVSATSVRWATNAGALLIAPGPYDGSYIVTGSSAVLLLPALSHGALLLDARFTGCGASPSKEP